MRVVEVVYEPAHSGQAEHVLALLAHLDRTRFAPIVCYPDGDSVMARRLAELGIVGHAWPMRRWANAGPAHGLWQLVRRERIPVVHVHGQFAGLWARLAAHLAGARIVYTPHTIRVRQRALATAYPTAERALGRLTDRLITVCEADRRQVADGWGMGERTVTIHNGIDWMAWDGYSRAQDEARRVLGWPADVPVVLQVGRLDVQKAPEVLVAAAVQVLQAQPAACFYLAGDGPLRDEIERLVQSEGLAGRLTLLGQRDDVPCLLAAADVVALSSRWEGLPYTLIEAAAMGRPAVCTAVNGSPEVIVDGETGLLVPPDDPSALAGALQALLCDPARAADMGDRARRRARATFDAKVMTHAIGEVYAQVVDEGQR